MERFKEAVLDTPDDVIVAFTAVWCAACPWLEPYLREVEEAGVPVFSIDVDRFPEAARLYRIGSVPIVLLFRDGVEVERSVGVEPERIRAMAGKR